VFRHLTDYEYRRSPLEVVGFYIAWWLLLSVAGAIIGAIGADISYQIGAPSGSTVGTVLGVVLAVIASVALSAAILSSKSALGHPGYLLLALASILGAVPFGSVVGLLAPAFLSTRAPRIAHRVVANSEISEHC
jgi:hypothetical protein